MQKRAQGLRSVVLPDGQVARLERTAAVERAMRVRRDGEDLDDAVAAVSGTWWSEGTEEGFRHHTDTTVPARSARPPTGEPASGRAHRIAARLRRRPRL